MRKPNRLYLLFHITLWFGITVMIFSFMRFVLPVDLTLGLVALRVSMLAALFYFHTEFLFPRLFIPGKLSFYFLGSIGVIVVAALLRLEIEHLWFDEQMTRIPIWRPGLPWATAFVSASLVALISLLYKLGRRQLSRERRNMELIAEQREAEIQLLRAQLNPHFLFNMLNNIYSLAIMQSPQTPDMILKLSELLRYVTYETREKRVSLAREVEYLHLLIEIFQMKSARPLPLTFEIEGDPKHLEVEPLLLVPLLENTFKHCDLSLPGAYIQLRLVVEVDGFEFATCNTKRVSAFTEEKEGGVGLENIRKRLGLRKGSASKLEVQEEENTFAVTLKWKQYGKVFESIGAGR